MTHLTPDVRGWTAATHRERDAVLLGARGSTRPLIGASWRRMKAHGLSPEGRPEVAPLAGAEVLRLREQSGLAPLLPLLRAHLLPTCEQTGQLMVVADVDGRVLWREGVPRVLRHADGLGFVGGSAWTEGNVGTNAIGTCLVTQTPVHVHAGEHYAESHTRWTCAAAPVRDPLTGRLLGVLDVSGPARTVHAGTVTLVSMAARLAELEIRARHEQRLHELRAVAAPLLARLGGRAVVVTPEGVPAAVTGLLAPERVALPLEWSGGDVWIPGLGRASGEAVPGGWLLRLEDDGDAGARQLELDLGPGEPRLTMTTAGSSWTVTPSPRHAEILVALLLHPEGRSAAELADDLFADPTRVVTVRAELSRLRKIVGPALLHRPYRIDPRIDARLVRPDRPDTALPGSAAPVVARLRTSAVAGGG